MHAEGPKADQPASTCEPTNSFSFSSITTSGATVSWEAVAGAASYYVHWQPVAGGTELNTQVSGTSVVLTGLDACTAYRVRIRTRCGPTTFSEFTVWSPFETASTNPSVSIEVEEADAGCARILYATTGFSKYVWSNGEATMDTDTVSGILISQVDTFWVFATDESGCTADAFYIVPALPGNCLTLEEDLELSDSLASDSLLYAKDMQLLALGMASLSGNDTIKELVKKIVLLNNSGNGGEYIAYFHQLMDSCSAKGINLVARLQAGAWANKLSGEAMDTTRIRTVLTNYTADDTRGTQLRPIVSYVYLSPEYQNSSYGTWDGVSVDWVVAASMHPIEHMPTYELVVNQLIRSTTHYGDWQMEKPVWQIGFELDVLNGFETKGRFMGGS